MENCEICNHACHCSELWCETCEDEFRYEIGHNCVHNNGLSIDNMSKATADKYMSGIKKDKDGFGLS
jgi:hypothetical protein